MSANDAFDNLLNLEEKYYSEGYEQGVADGDRAGRVEGRSFGIEKGFEKFVEAGRLHGKSIVWANRLPQPQESAAASTPTSSENERLPTLSGGGARLAKNVVTLYGLVEPDTLSTENTDEAVNDFDDRVKRAQGKARVIERQIGEDIANTPSAGVKEGTSVKGGRAGGAGATGGSQPSSSAATPSKGAVSF
ncbi:hypothetical protein VPNG_08399 [Cytospora leucostoma]|uniref:Essential protein Yae1 N-terminal domain-containing protein n=1 Tax=Cytospora leucostoma TaxID=1230097 RepID=A0A423W694_9PEZI|nr:hypothetical protein VPNG_08399 [Cytospora leucostoma]